MKQVLTTPVMGAPTRVAVGTQTLPFTVVLLLLVVAELTFAFIVFAVVRPEPIWWLLSGGTIAAGCIFFGKFAYGRRDWDRTTHLELGDGKVTFVPSRNMRVMGHAAVEASFPIGGILEYHVETGDRYFTGDHGQFLRASLWIAGPGGTKHRLLNDVVAVNPKTMATNLRNEGIPFRVIKIYDSETGEHVESDVTASYAQARDNVAERTAFGILMGTSNLWLGVMAALFFHKIWPVVAIGIVGYFLISIATLRSKTFKRTALVHVATVLPIYAAGYAFAVIAVWYLFRR
jgi:hypothetical protein